MSPAAAPIHVGHVVRAMNRGGVESWLMMLLRRIDPGRLRFTFLTQTGEPAAFDDEIRRLGGRIVPCLEPHRPWRYARALRRAFAEHGPFDVIHSHVQHYSGLVCLLARRAGIPVRIAHAHSDDRALQARAKLGRRAYLALTHHWMRRHASAGLAASARAAAAVFDADWARQRGREVLYLGIDLAPFRAATDRAAARAELGLPADAWVVAHVGRFEEVKNHRFLVRVMAELARLDERAHLVLVGDGPLRAPIAAEVRAAGLDARVRFAGLRADVPRLLAAADAFVLPSLFEGLPLAALEAQAAGLPCLLSDAITEEVAAVPEAVRWQPLAAGPERWARELVALRSYARAPAAALARLEASRFDLGASLRRLEEVYVLARG